LEEKGRATLPWDWGFHICRIREEAKVKSMK